MKHNFFLKAVFTLLMGVSVTLASAAHLYLSSAGLDTNNGLSAGTAVKTLSKAFTISLAGDTIHVMDMININQEPVGAGSRTTIDITGLYLPPATLTPLVKDGVTYTTWNTANGTNGIIPHTRSITIIGDDKASCGFDGNNVSCIIRQDHGSVAGTVITYKNLTFQNGKSNDSSGGGGVYFRGAAVSTANFENCDFKNNVGNQGTALKPGGALSIVHGTATVKKCSFTGNTATKGGALYIQAGNVVMDSCMFENNDLSATATTVGGAIYSYPTSTTAGPLNLEIKNSLFKNNKAENQGGAVWIGETVAMPTNLKFINCAFVDNSTLNANGQGGAVFINNVLTGGTENLSFINTTFKGNQAGGTAGGAITANGLLVNSQLNLINCTISGNKVSGITGASGAGIRFLKATAAGVRKIQNCIIENNTAVDANIANDVDYADLGMEKIIDPVTLAETPTYVAGTTLIIDKSIIGSCQNPDFATQFPTNNVNYIFAKDGDVTKSFVAKLGAFDEEKNYFPLLAGSPAIGYGNATYLSGLTPAVITDQIGRYRPETNCSAGAYEFATVAAPNGLKNIQKGSLVVYRNANNQLVVNNTTANAGIITVCNMMGQVVATAELTGAVTTINKAIKAGAYIVMLSANGKVSTQKVILN